MEKRNDYIKLNRDSWNKRTAFHMKSDFYDMAGFLKGESSLNEIEQILLGDVRGKTILHLQCHFGQDTLSLQRMGANVTGVDFSDKAIEEARGLNAKLGLKAEFICCDIYSLPEYLTNKFDIVFTSYGVIGWLPDLDRWGKIISEYLKPGGKFIMAEFHPVVWMFDNDFEEIKYSYFQTDAIVELEENTYADKNAPINSEIVTWNHSLSDVLNSLIQSGLEIIKFDEYDYSPYDCFNHAIQESAGKYRISHLHNRIPMIFSILASKKELPEED